MIFDPAVFVTSLVVTVSATSPPGAVQAVPVCRTSHVACDSMNGDPSRRTATVRSAPAVPSPDFSVSVSVADRTTVPLGTDEALNERIARRSQSGTVLDRVSSVALLWL